MTIGRRTLLAGMGGTAALGLAGLPHAAWARQVGAIGLQLYTVREVFQRDPVATLEKIAAIGYREVEYGGGGYDAMDHAMLRRTMDRLHLTAPSIHVPYEMLRDRFAAALAMTRALGATTVVMPWLAEEQRSERGFADVIPSLRRFGTQLRAAGIGFAYHNHDFEFTTRAGGRTLYDRLIAEIDPATMRFELDLYWAAHAGVNVGALIDRLGARLYAFHVKDMRADRSMTAVGAGTIDFAALFRRPGAAGVRHFYVENDEAPAPYFPDITASYRALRALRF